MQQLVFCSRTQLDNYVNNDHTGIIVCTNDTERYRMASRINEALIEILCDWKYIAKAAPTQR